MWFGVVMAFGDGVWGLRSNGAVEYLWLQTLGDVFVRICMYGVRTFVNVPLQVFLSLASNHPFISRSPYLYLHRRIRLPYQVSRKCPGVDIAFIEP